MTGMLLVWCTGSTGFCLEIGLHHCCFGDMLVNFQTKQKVVGDGRDLTHELICDFKHHIINVDWRCKDILAHDICFLDVNSLTVLTWANWWVSCWSCLICVVSAAIVGKQYEDCTYFGPYPQAGRVEQFSIVSGV